MAETDNVLSTRKVLEDLQRLWLPTLKLEKLGDAIPEKSAEDILRGKVLSLVNKLTPEKLESLLEQLKALYIHTESILDVAIQMLFDRAISEALYCATYAKAIKHLAHVEVPTKKGESINVQLFFLNKCQNELEQTLCDLNKYEDLIETGYIYLLSDEHNFKPKLLGIVRLIGELFNQHVLNEVVLFECIDKLHSKEQETLMEALCLLLKITGKELNFRKDEYDYSAKLDLLFQDMQEIIDSKQTCPRIRFMLQDVIDLKENDWVPRSKQMIPKTIEEIHSEATNEIVLLLSQVNLPSNNKCGNR